jgi:hypothetical protein
LCREVEVVCLLQYVANQLKSSESLDLLVLKEMVQTMTVGGCQREVGSETGRLGDLAGYVGCRGRRRGLRSVVCSALDTPGSC